MAQDSGYVLIAYQHWTIEASLWVACLVFILFFLLCYVCIRSLSTLFHIPKYMRRFQKMRACIKRHEWHMSGFCAGAEGRFSTAEKIFIRALKLHHTSVMTYLLAAEAAHKQQAYERRDDYLRAAYEGPKKFKLAVAMTQARLFIDSGQEAVAFEILQSWYKQYPKHPYLLTLLQKVVQRREDWEQLYVLLPALYRYRVAPIESLHRLEKKMYLHRIDQAGKHSLSTLMQVWQSAPSHVQQEIACLDLWIIYLLRYQQVDKAMAWIESTMKKKWHAVLARRYAAIQGTISQHQLSRAELWLKAYPQEWESWFCAGSLYLREHFLQRAEECLTESLRLQASPLVYTALGRLFEKKNNQIRAIYYFKKGIAKVQEEF